MAEVRTLARPYARSVFEIARDADALAQWSQALAAVADVVANDDVRSVMGNPNVSDRQLADSIIGIAGGDSLPQDAASYVRLLADNKRLVLAPAIAEAFEDMRAEYEKRMDVTVVTASEFSEQQQQALSDSLQQRLSANVSLSFERDDSLIAGAVIHAGDLVIDHSMRYQLERMQQRLTQ